jgi:hypothetical protein
MNKNLRILFLFWRGAQFSSLPQVQKTLVIALLIVNAKNIGG